MDAKHFLFESASLTSKMKLLKSHFKIFMSLKACIFFTSGSWKMIPSQIKWDIIQVKFYNTLSIISINVEHACCLDALMKETCYTLILHKTLLTMLQNYYFLLVLEMTFLLVNEPSILDFSNLKTVLFPTKFTD